MHINTSLADPKRVNGIEQLKDAAVGRHGSNWTQFYQIMPHTLHYPTVKAKARARAAGNEIPRKHNVTPTRASTAPAAEADIKDSYDTTYHHGRGGQMKRHRTE
jgi:hypothetical protein